MKVCVLMEVLQRNSGIALNFFIIFEKKTEIDVNYKIIFLCLLLEPTIKHEKCSLKGLHCKFQTPHSKKTLYLHKNT